MTDNLRDAIAALQADDAPTERECGYQDAIDEVLRILDARAALAAAPQPAPVDREALVEVLRPYVGTAMALTLADALLARGLRLPVGAITAKDLHDALLDAGTGIVDTLDYVSTDFQEGAITIDAKVDLKALVEWINRRLSGTVEERDDA